jgi:hypothetical protein
MEPGLAPPPSRNLLILHTPQFQERSDWETVKEKIESRAPDIEVRIDDNLKPSPETSDWQTTRPSLVFSPFALVGYRPRGGAVFAGKHMGKGAEWLQLQQSGLPVPPTLRLVPGLVLDREVWGDHVIVKPGLGTLGQGVRLLRTDEVGRRFAELTEDGRLRILVQHFIDHVDEDGHPCAWRVLTMFGEPLVQVEHRWVEPRRPLAEIAADPAGRIASNAVDVKGKRRLVKVPEVLALARRVAAAFPTIPCLGQDIIRQTGTGTLWILETNPGGYTWHLSSPHSRADGFDPDYVNARYAQFDALEVAAETLIAKTRTAAV